MTDAMTERRKQLLEERLRERNVKSSSPEPVVAREPGTPSPLSDAQRRMWFVQNLDPTDTTLNVCVAYRLSGPLDAARLHQACADVVARHEILRSTYGVDENGEPFQVSAAAVELPWQQDDLRELPVDRREWQAHEWARREFARPFDLTADIPIRVSLLRIADEEHILVLVVHHVGWDDESWPVFFTEVNAAYRGEQVPVPPVQYVDAALGNRPADDAELDFWRGELTPPPGRVEFGRTQPGTARSRDAGCASRQVSPALTEQIVGLARAHATTPFTVLLTAFEAAIQFYSGATDFLVSVPVVNRGANAEKLIGYFGNAVLLRAQPEPTSDFAALLDRVRDASSAAFAHQNVGLDRVVREVSPPRSGGGDALTQLVQVSFSSRSAAGGFDLEGVDVAELPWHSAVAPEELGLLIVGDGSGGLRVEATYQTAALTPELVEQFLDHYLRLLTAAVGDPSTPLRDIDILGEAERARLSAASHGRQVDTPATTMVALVESQAASTPTNDAVISDTDHLTFADLDTRANRLAHWMIGQGIGTEDIVALRMTTSVEFIVASLAVLKAGAAYLPIDPAYPADRIDYLRADARPALELDFDGYGHAVTSASAYPATDPVDADRVRPLRPANTAYVIYTSGSTGQPKGVPVPHNAIAEHLLGFNDEWALTTDDRVLQSTSVSFDASLLDIYVTLTAGACVVVPKANAYRDIPYVADLVSRQGVTVLHMVPSMLATFLMLPEAADWSTLRHVPVGGEALVGEIADRFATQFDAHLRNHYGPTEAVVSSTHMEVEGPQGAGVVPIGIPNQNVDLYILDDALRLVPDGVAGEIYLGGNQLARGYLHRAGLTAQRFVADPFRPGARLYRTGDLVRRNPSGEIDFLGRADEQVKVRGFRIELGEVETTITEHDDVAHAVVIVVDDPVAGPALAAYLVAGPDSSPDVEAIRSYVAGRLPAHMVPATFTVIEEVPLTAHGKLDKRALPAPEAVAAPEYREPTTSAEKRVAALLGSLFQRDQVGADDSFFTLGGHSLLAARLITMIRAEFGVELDMRVPFDSPTVTALAAAIGEAFFDEFGISLDEFDGDPELDVDTGADGAATADADAAPAVGMVPTPQTRPEYIPLSYSQRAYWMQRRMEGAVDGENVTYPLRLEGPIDREALIAAVNDVVARHESLRTTFPEHNATPYQLIHPAQPIEVPVVELDGSEERLDRELDADAGYVFDLAAETLLRVRLLVLHEQDCVLSVLLHHIIADRSSCEIFAADLITAYRARVRGQAPEWPALPIGFADFAIWQRAAFDRGPGRELSDVGRRQLDYWREALAGLPDEINVAHDHPRPQILGHNGISTARRVPAEIWNRAITNAESVGATEFMLCQSVGASVLNALGAGDDLAIGAAVANRLGEATDQVIGLFANVVVLRSDLSGDPTPRTVLERVRNSALDAITHQGVPFERLVETLNPPRSLARNPLFQVMMHVRHRATPEPFSEDGSTTFRDVAKFYEVSFMDFHFDYTVDVNGDLILRIVVNPDLYDAATGEVFADVTVGVLEAFANRVDAPLSALDVLPDGWDTSRCVVKHASATPDSAGPELSADTPVTETEHTLIALLEELLDIEDVEREDGFFALGGDSVIAIQWAGRAAAVGLPLTPQMVFEHFTMFELAAAVDDAIANPPEPDGTSDETAPAESAPMSVSGLGDDALAALKDSWAARG
nr:non-ribosomal peptide synthetase [Gordonia bronchialis]